MRKLRQTHRRKGITAKRAHIYRSDKTGRFVSADYAKARPKITTGSYLEILRDPFGEFAPKFKPKTPTFAQPTSFDTTELDDRELLFRKIIKDWDALSETLSKTKAGRDKAHRMAVFVKLGKRWNAFRFKKRLKHFLTPEIGKYNELGVDAKSFWTDDNNPKAAAKYRLQIRLGFLDEETGHLDSSSKGGKTYHIKRKTKKGGKR